MDTSEGKRSTNGVPKRVKKIKSASNWLSWCGILLFLFIVVLLVMALNKEEYILFVGVPILLLTGIMCLKISSAFESIALHIQGSAPGDQMDGGG